MTERKSTEIKFRVTPSEKARWQAEADRLGDSVSEWMRKTLNGSCLETWVPQPGTQARNGIVAEGDLVRDLATGVTKIARWTPESYPVKVHEYSDTALAMRPYSKLAAPAERRKEPCSHSKPPYAFCAECDR